MLYRLIIIFTIFHICTSPKMLHAQADSAKIPKNSVYIEAGGKGQLYSINYEREMYKSGIVKGELALGGAYFKSLSAWYTSLEHNVLIGRNIHNLELGAGVNYRFFTDESNTTEPFYINGRIGYRFQPQENGILVRISYTPIFRPKDGLLQWVGLSFGYAF